MLEPDARLQIRSFHQLLEHGQGATLAPDFQVHPGDDDGWPRFDPEGGLPAVVLRELQRRGDHRLVVAERFQTPADIVLGLPEAVTDTHLILVAGFRGEPQVSADVVRQLALHPVQPDVGACPTRHGHDQHEQHGQQQAGCVNRNCVTHSGWFLES